MSKLYQSAAIVFLNTLLLSAVVLCLLWGALELRHKLSGRGHVVLSDVIKLESFSLTPPDVAKATAAEFDAYADTQPFVFNPWTTFMLAPVKGQYLNVVEGPLFNHRITPGSATGDGSFKIWCFGGSTLYGFGVPDDQSVPSHLARILNERGQLGGVEVVNYGQPYWFSGVELAAYNALLTEENKPDIVIFLDGLNDMAHLVAGRTTPFFADQGNVAWERRRNDARRLLPWLSINESFPLTRVARYLQNVAGETQDDVGVFRERNSFTASQVSAAFFNNMRKARVLSEAFGVRSIFLLQPVPWFGSYATEDVDTSFGFGSKQVAIEAYTEMAAQFGDRQDAFSLQGVLWDHPAPFVDNIHYSDDANRLLATEIADIVLGATR